MQRFTDDDIRWLAGLLAAEGLDEIEVQEGDEAVTVTARLAATPPVVSAEGPAPTALPHDFIPLLAPMPGLFYRAPSPDSPTYVQVGDFVERGDVVGLIEVMKMFNEVTAPVSGVVRRILVESGAQVQQDQPLMHIQLASQ